MGLRSPSEPLPGSGDKVVIQDFENSEERASGDTLPCSTAWNHRARYRVWPAEQAGEDGPSQYLNVGAS